MKPKEKKKTTIWTKLGLLLLLVCGLIWASSFSTNKDLYDLAIVDGRLQSCIMVDGKLYWKVQATATLDQGTKLGEVKKVASSGYIPSSNGMVSADLSQLVKEDIYQNGEDILIADGESVIVFRYVDHMDLGKQVSEEEWQAQYQAQIASGQDVDPAAYPPHVIYQNMSYSTGEGRVDKLPEAFQLVGSITASYAHANQNFTGNMDVGTQLYASDLQNYYLLAKLEGQEDYLVLVNNGYFE